MLISNSRPLKFMDVPEERFETLICRVYVSVLSFGCGALVGVELRSSARGCQRLAQCEHAAAVVCTARVEQQRLQGGETSPVLLSDDHSWHSSDFSQVSAMTTAEAFQSGQMEGCTLGCVISVLLFEPLQKGSVNYRTLFEISKAGEESRLFLLSTQLLGHP